VILTIANLMLPLSAATSVEHRGAQCLMALVRSLSPVPSDQFPLLLCARVLLIYKPFATIAFGACAGASIAWCVVRNLGGRSRIMFVCVWFSGLCGYGGGGGGGAGVKLPSLSRRVSTSVSK